MEMEKSILVMDTPKNCKECKFSEYQGIVCRAIGLNKSHSDLGKPDWCPLQDAPEKDDGKGYLDDDAEAYCKGWNACVDKILNGGLTE